MCKNVDVIYADQADAADFVCTEQTCQVLYILFWHLLAQYSAEGADSAELHMKGDQVPQMSSS